MQIPYELIGILFIYLSIISLFVSGIALILGIYSIKKRKILFPNFVIFTLYFFYSPLVWICKKLSIKENIVDEILIEIKNSIGLEGFKKVKNKKIILLPQCMRHNRCKTRCDSLYGYECTKCNLCDIGTIVEVSEKYDFKVFIVPGGSFVKKIIKHYRPKSCIGVACFVELIDSMHMASKYMEVQGVCLMNDGCYNTKVEVEEIVKKMELCNEYK